jgi:hypothetical protein
MGARPKIIMPPMPASPPDASDQALRDLQEREGQKDLLGSARRRSFITAQKEAFGKPRLIPPLGVKKLLGT